MSKLYVQHDYAVTGRDYVETDGGDTPAGGIDYSTEEQDTGLKWIDGSPIFQKTIVYTTAIAANSTTTLALADYIGADIATIVEINGITGSGIPVNSRWPQGGYNWGIATYVSDSNLNIVNGANNIDTGIYITIKYTKTE